MPHCREILSARLLRPRRRYVDAHGDAGAGNDLERRFRLGALAADVGGVGGVVPNLLAPAAEHQALSFSLPRWVLSVFTSMPVRRTSRPTFGRPLVARGGMGGAGRGVTRCEERRPLADHPAAAVGAGGAGPGVEGAAVAPVVSSSTAVPA